MDPQHEPDLPPLGEEVMIRRGLVVFLVAFWVVMLGVVSLPRSAEGAAVVLMLVTAGLGAVVPWFVWLPASESHVVLGPGVLHVPTILGWRTVSLTPLRASARVVALRGGITERRWKLANGWQRIILIDPDQPVAELVGGTGQPEGRTLEDLLVAASGVPAPVQKHWYSGLGRALWLGTVKLLWIFCFTMGVVLGALVLVGRA